MKTIFTFLAAVLITCTTLAADTDPNPTMPVPNNLAEQPAKFMGDNNLIERWLLGEVVYPVLALENSREGQVVIAFTIDENGRPKDFVTQQGVGLGCDEAVIHAIQRMPRWAPARAKGEAIPVRLVVTVDFGML